MRIMPSILFHCIQQNYMIGNFSHRDWTPESTTDPLNIRSYTNKIARMDYDAASKAVVRRNGIFAAEGIQSNNNENIYWQIILKGAAQLDPASLPSAKGPTDDFSAAEKSATYDFMVRAGLGTSASNQRQCRWFWKAFYDFRERDVRMITCYRTPEFNRYCRDYPRGRSPSLADTIVSWEAVYGPLVDLLERRTYEHRMGDLSGRLHLKMKCVTGRLCVPESAWNDGGNPWFSDTEEATFQLTEAIPAGSSQTISGLFNDRGNTTACENKSLFVALRGGDCQPLLTCPMIAVSEGDFLGVFAGTIRYSEDDFLIQRIPGPAKHLFLDYSRVTGTLNQMQVCQDHSRANVRLEWQAVNEQDVAGGCEYWRVIVLATRRIAPFEPLARVAPSQEQFVLHQSAHHARQGFLE
ncbi:hypothetical protein F4818DRAFT_234762 [Hypoxylon cercidicola]|nr:hypothetical protein F4818DRAFT_234762 [Hypoxylon cercidicola]